MLPGWGILTCRHLDLLIGEWRERRGPGNDLSWKIPRRHLIEFPAFMSEQWLNQRWVVHGLMSFLTPVSYLSLKVYNTMFFQFIIYKSLLPAWHHFNRCSALSLWHKKQKICVFLNVEWFVPGSCQIWWKLESYPMVSILNLKPKSWLKS